VESNSDVCQEVKRRLYDLIFKSSGLPPMLTGLTMFKQCIHLGDILNAQIEISDRHIDKHKWFHLIENPPVSEFMSQEWV